MNDIPQLVIDGNSTRAVVRRILLILGLGVSFFVFVCVALDVWFFPPIEHTHPVLTGIVIFEGFGVISVHWTLTAFRDLHKVGMLETMGTFVKIGLTVYLGMLAVGHTVGLLAT